MQETKILDARTILISIRQYLSSDLEGFRTILNDMNSLEEKRRFIAACKKMVEKGWQEEFEAIEGLQIFKPYLTNPCEKLKLNRASGPAAQYFTRLCVLKLMAEVCIEDHALIDEPTWFQAMKDKLADEFKKFEQQSNIKFVYNGKEIKNLADLQELREKAQQLIEGRIVFKLAVLIAMAASLGTSLLRVKKIDVPVNVQIGISVAISLTVIFFFATKFIPAVGGHRAMMFTNNAERGLAQQPVQAGIMADNNIQKFFLLSNEDLKKLEGRPTVAPK